MDKRIAKLILMIVNRFRCKWLNFEPIYIDIYIYQMLNIKQTLQKTKQIKATEFKWRQKVSKVECGTQCSVQSMWIFRKRFSILSAINKY